MLLCIPFKKKNQYVTSQGPNQNSVDNLNNVRLEAMRHLKDKNKEYLKATILNLKPTAR